VLMHATYQRREQTSWRSWGSINNPQAAAEESQRIAKELRTLAEGAGFPMTVLPVRTVTSEAEAKKVHETEYDVVLVYPATGSGNLLRACWASPPRDTLIFARHKNGPTYYWYEALSTRYLKTAAELDPAAQGAANHGPLTVDDVVIDEYEELRWRLRALYGVKNFIGQRIVALGGAMGKYDPEAPKVARDKYRLQVVDVTYDELGKRLEALRKDARFMAQAEKWTDRYLALPKTTLATERPFVVNAFLLYAVFKQWMREHRAPAFTIQACMGTVMPLAKTTACLTLSWMNDEGLMAFCESDFVIIPAGIFLHYVTGRPVFLHNSTFPHRGVVTCAHCTGPRRMDGERYEPATITTHYESDYGAAPKVEMPIGQQVTFIDPEFATGRWVGFKGIVQANPCLEICRSQQDVQIQGDWKKLLAEIRDSHWVMAYGDHLAPLGYAARKIGVRWVDFSSGDGAGRS
jgi:L-fucose isomerase-like protein